MYGRSRFTSLDVARSVTLKENTRGSDGKMNLNRSMDVYQLIAAMQESAPAAISIDTSKSISGKLLIFFDKDSYSQHVDTDGS